MPNPVCDVCGEPILIAINMNDGVCSENCRKALAEMKKATENTYIFDYSWEGSVTETKELPQDAKAGCSCELCTEASKDGLFPDETFVCELCGGSFSVSQLAYISEEGLSACVECYCVPMPAEEACEPAVDLVNHPPHYKTHPYGIECIEVTEHMNFCTGNTVKYIWRAGEKGDVIQDLEKALWYLKREIKRRKKTHDQTPTFWAEPVVYDFDDEEE